MYFGGVVAREVLQGGTRGYRRHPQLVHFRDRASPTRAIAPYLRGLHGESVVRGYRFHAGPIDEFVDTGVLPVARGQIQYEQVHLLAKPRVRDPERTARFGRVRFPAPHPLFRIVPGGVEPWELPRPAEAGDQSE